jgi:hypothetical protein
MTSPAPPRRASRDLLTGLALLVVALAAAGYLAFRSAPAHPRPPEGGALLDESLSLEGGAVLRRVRLVGPQPIEVAVEPSPEGATVEVQMGPAAPAEAGGGPDPATATVWTVRAGDKPRRLPGFVTGLHAIRVVPAAGGAKSVRLRVSVPGG